MKAMASQITNISIVCSTVGSDVDKKTSKLRVTGLCKMNSRVTCEFPAHKASNAENVSIWWRHYERYSLDNDISYYYIIRSVFIIMEFIVAVIIVLLIPLSQYLLITMSNNL